MTIEKIMNIFTKSYELWGESEHNRREWVRKTVALYKRGHHASITGGWKIQH